MNLRRLARFGVVGAMNTAIYFGTYLVLHSVLQYMIAHVIAFVTAMVCSYFLNCYITFKTPPRWKTFVLFPLSSVASFVVTTVGLRVAVQVFGLDERIAPLIVAVVAIPITYVVAHFIMIGPRAEPLRPPVTADVDTRNTSSR